MSSGIGFGLLPSFVDGHRLSLGTGSFVKSNLATVDAAGIAAERKGPRY